MKVMWHSGHWRLVIGVVQYHPGCSRSGMYWGGSAVVGGGGSASIP